MAKSIIPLSGLLLTIQGISEVFRAIICIKTGHWPERLSADAEETEKVLMRTSQKDDQADVIYRLFPTKVQGWIDLILYFIFFFPGVIALAFYGYEYAAKAWMVKETSWNSPAQIQISVSYTHLTLPTIYSV